VARTEGNVSARTPEGNVLITPSGLDYAVTEPEDIVVVSLDGKTLEGSFEPSVETVAEVIVVLLKRLEMDGKHVPETFVF